MGLGRPCLPLGGGSSITPSRCMASMVTLAISFPSFPSRVLRTTMRMSSGRTSSRLGIADVIVLYDLTNAHYHGGHDGELPSFGRSKQKRHDCPLITLALALDGAGFPRSAEILPGNASEPDTLRDAVAKLEAECGTGELKPIDKCWTSIRESTRTWVRITTRLTRTDGTLIVNRQDTRPAAEVAEMAVAAGVPPPFIARGSPSRVDRITRNVVPSWHGVRKTTF